MDLDIAKKRFANHVATFTDYGNIKILDFKHPDNSEYRIRFLFEEEYYRLHITGDLGDLIASNYCNMCWDRFERDYANNAGYFEEKIDTMSKPLYCYDSEMAERQLREKLAELIDDDIFDTAEEKINDIVYEVMSDFTDSGGIGSHGCDIISEHDADYYEWVGDIGKKSTNILELYLLAFRLAKQQLRQEGQI